jgi:hypothetical protein
MTDQIKPIQPCPWCGFEAGITGEVYRHAQCLSADCAACGPCCRTTAEAAIRWNLLGAVVRMSKMVRAGYQHALSQLMDAVHALEAQDRPSRPIGNCSVCGRSAWVFDIALNKYVCVACRDVGRIPVKGEPDGQ